MKDTILDDAGKIRGVRGAAALDPPGKILASNVESKELNAFFESISVVATAGTPAKTLGGILAIAVRTDKDNDLSLVIQDKQALALVSDRSRPATEVVGEARELLKQG